MSPAAPGWDKQVASPQGLVLHAGGHLCEPVLFPVLPFALVFGRGRRCLVGGVMHLKIDREPRKD
jgi:hypothetical protein